MWWVLNAQYAALFLLVIAPLLALATALASRFGGITGFSVTLLITLYGLYGVGYLDNMLKLEANPILRGSVAVLAALPFRGSHPAPLLQDRRAADRRVLDDDPLLRRHPRRLRRYLPPLLPHQTLRLSSQFQHLSFIQPLPNMSRIPSIAITTGLIGSGVLAWAFAGRPLVEQSRSRTRRSIRSASMAAPTARFSPWPCRDRSTPTSMASMAGGTGHQARRCRGMLRFLQAAKAASRRQRRIRFQNLLVSLEKATETRTNPKAASEAHKRYLRRQVEDKLRFAYQARSRRTTRTTTRCISSSPNRSSAPGRNSRLPPRNSPRTPSNTASSRKTIPARPSPPPPPPPTSCELMFNDQQNAAAEVHHRADAPVSRPAGSLHRPLRRHRQAVG